MTIKYSDLTVSWLKEEGYTHCFFLAGGNIMHLLNSAREVFTCIAVVNEVAAGIAVEYFNATRDESEGRAFALVTAGPGVTNIVTAIAGAFLESRELLVLAGQVKSADLATTGLRQRGIQEIDGMALVESLVVDKIQIREPISREDFLGVVAAGKRGRKGPVYVELCLDAQASPILEAPHRMANSESQAAEFDDPPDLTGIRNLVLSSERPLLLIGGGVSRKHWLTVESSVRELGIPVATSWNAIDRIDYEDDHYFGRPDTWGMRWSNILIQQSDLIIAVGVRLSLQQTGFNWQEFAPDAHIVHVDLDRHELEKPHPKKHKILEMRSETFLSALCEIDASSTNWQEWRDFGQYVKKALPLNDEKNVTGRGYLSPYKFADRLSAELTASDVLVPCSSGGASTVLMQAFKQRKGQIILNNKALASMGYGLSGAIGAAIAHQDRRVVLVEGDGGFAQNLQELGTVRAQSLNLKIFIFENNGYASIRMTQRNYFGGAYLGCDSSTGLGLPNWQKLADAYDIPFHRLDAENPFEGRTTELMQVPGPAIFLVPLDPEQTFYPKIDSRINSFGEMTSSPLHEMSPPLSRIEQTQLLKYLEVGGSA